MEGLFCGDVNPSAGRNPTARQELPQAARNLPHVWGVLCTCSFCSDALGSKEIRMMRIEADIIHNLFAIIDMLPLSMVPTDRFTRSQDLNGLVISRVSEPPTYPRTEESLVRLEMPSLLTGLTKAFVGPKRFRKGHLGHPKEVKRCPGCPDAERWAELLIEMACPIAE